MGILSKLFKKRTGEKPRMLDYDEPRKPAELIMADHKRNCGTCAALNCKLQKKMGVVYGCPRWEEDRTKTGTYNVGRNVTNESDPEDE